MASPNWPNRSLFHGDNLPFLRAMNSESVDLIATDPPFNKNKDFHATPDSLSKGASFQDRWTWEKDVHLEWVDQIEDDHPKLMEAIDCARRAHSDSMGAFLCFMAVRLLAMHRILKPTGSLYLHCDPTASHYLKMTLDAIFGPKNFKNEIIWCYTGPGNAKRYFPRKHDTLLFYSKSDSWIFNPGDIKVPYKKLSTGKTTGIFKQAATLSEEGKVPESWWSDFSPVGRIKSERIGWPTQKPLALYERIIKASSNEGDRVLDPFCGCATTLVAAERLGRQWVGIDIWQQAHQIVLDRFKSEGIGDPDKKDGTWNNLHYTKTPPQRTDDGETAAPFLRVKKRIVEPEGKKMSRAEMYDFLIDQQGLRCQGCDRPFDDRRYLELDHNTPRADGGINHISNRILLCGPCNRLKSHVLTLSGLRRKNEEMGYLYRP